MRIKHQTYCTNLTAVCDTFSVSCDWHQGPCQGACGCRRSVRRVPSFHHGQRVGNAPAGTCWAPFGPLLRERSTAFVAIRFSKREILPFSRRRRVISFKMSCGMGCSTASKRDWSGSWRRPAIPAGDASLRHPCGGVGSMERGAIVRLGAASLSGVGGAAAADKQPGEANQTRAVSSSRTPNVLFIGILSGPKDIARRMNQRRAWMQHPLMAGPNASVVVRYFVG